MRTIDYPRVTAIDNAIEITADPQNINNGNASHHYEVRIRPKEDEVSDKVRVAAIDFQDGPIAEFGINGTGAEAVLAILIDRLQCFQSSKFSCRENAIALTHLEDALHWLNHRTLKRQNLGVEGTHQTRPDEGKK